MIKVTPVQSRFERPHQPGNRPNPTGSLPCLRRQSSAPGRTRQGRLRRRCAGAPRPL